MSVVLSEIIAAYESIAKHAYLSMKVEKEVLFSKLFHRSDQAFYWDDFSAWVKGWIQHYGELKAGAKGNAQILWMAQHLPILYYLQTFSKLSARLKAHGFLKQMTRYHPRTWQPLQDKLLVLGGALQHLLKWKAHMNQGIFWQESSKLCQALFPVLVNSLAMSIAVLCKTVAPGARSIEHVALRNVLLHPIEGERLLMRLMGGGVNQKKPGVVLSFVKQHKWRWSDYLRLALLIIFALILLYNGALFYVHYPKRIVDTYWKWMFGAGIGLFVLFCDWVYRRYIRTTDAKKAVIAFATWLKLDVRPMAKEAYAPCMPDIPETKDTSKPSASPEGTHPFVSI